MYSPSNKKSIAISISGVSKSYEIGKSKDSSLRSTLSQLFKRTNSRKEEFWALSDVSFDVEEGSVVGIIGKNGAGKSTLLKILSQITQPTKGRIEINGRVASLLEVGTGFHPELTGKENIFLNGTILGMSRKEIHEKFDEIVSFSGVEKFIHTPVKHYSSGMYVRLAFSVAAHLEPEILIIDEVLAVGDASFQKRCLGKMEEIAGKGRTVLFVSHDLGAVRSLCNKGVLLDKGKVIHNGDIEEVIARYTDPGSGQNAFVKLYNSDSIYDNDGTVKLESMRLIDHDRNTFTTIYLDQKIGVELVFEVLKPEIRPVPNIHLSHGLGGKVFVSVENCSQDRYSRPGRYRTTLWLPSNLLNSGHFTVGAALSTLDPVQVHAADYKALSFEVLDVLDAVTRNGYTGKMDGYLRPVLDWDSNLIE